MARRIWVIAKKETVEQSDIDDANLNNCSEVVNGIPPALQEILSEGLLPIAYEEPMLPESEPPRDLAAEVTAQKAEIDELKARLVKLEPKQTGTGLDNAQIKKSELLRR